MNIKTLYKKNSHSLTLSSMLLVGGAFGSGCARGNTTIMKKGFLLPKKEQPPTSAAAGSDDIMEAVNKLDSVAGLSSLDAFNKLFDEYNKTLDSLAGFSIPDAAAERHPEEYAMDIDFNLFYLDYNVNVSSGL